MLVSIYSHVLQPIVPRGALKNILTGWLWQICLGQEVVLLLPGIACHLHRVILEALPVTELPLCISDILSTISLIKISIYEEMTNEPWRSSPLKAVTLESLGDSLGAAVFGFHKEI